MKRFLPRETGLFLFVLAVHGAGLASAARVGIDARYPESPSNLLTGKDFDEFRYTILTGSNTLVSVTSFTTPEFRYLDALVLRQSLVTNDLFTSTELSDIRAFVSSGHGLLLLAEAGSWTDGTVSNLNQLAETFGVVFGPAPVFPNGFTLSGFCQHPVTLGVTNVGVDFGRPIVRFTPPAIDLTLSSGDSDLLAVVNGADAGGNVVLVGDTSLWTDTHVLSDRNITFGNNRLLLTNIIEFLTIPSLQASIQTNSIQLSWSSSMGTLYHLEWSEDLPQGNWQQLTNEVYTAGIWKFVYDNFSQARRYYRLARP